MVPCPSSLEGLQPVDGFAELWLHGPSTTLRNLVIQWHLQSGDSKLTHHLPLFSQTSVNGASLCNSPSHPVLETPGPSLAFLSLAKPYAFQKTALIMALSC